LEDDCFITVRYTKIHFLRDADRKGREIGNEGKERGRGGEGE